MITFFPTEPGTTTPEPTDEAEKERRERLTAEVDLGRMSERVEQRVLRAVERLGLSRESLGRPTGQSASGTVEGFLELQCLRSGRHATAQLANFLFHKIPGFEDNDLNCSASRGDRSIEPSQLTYILTDQSVKKTLARGARKSLVTMSINPSTVK